MPQFQANKQRDCFDREETTVDVVAKKQVVGVWTEASDLEYLNHIEKLPVYISNYGNRGSDVDDIAFFHQKLFGFCTDGFNDGVCQEFLVVEALYALIQVDAC